MEWVVVKEQQTRRRGDASASNRYGSKHGPGSGHRGANARTGWYHRIPTRWGGPVRSPLRAGRVPRDEYRWCPTSDASHRGVLVPRVPHAVSGRPARTMLVRARVCEPGVAARPVFVPVRDVAAWGAAAPGIATNADDRRSACLRAVECVPWLLQCARTLTTVLGNAGYCRRGEYPVLPRRRRHNVMALRRWPRPHGPMAARRRNRRVATLLASLGQGTGGMWPAAAQRLVGCVTIRPMGVGARIGDVI